MPVMNLPSPDELENLEAERLTKLGGLVKHEHLRRRNAFRVCAHCGASWLARANARYCQPSCRLAAFRERKKATHD